MSGFFSFWVGAVFAALIFVNAAQAQTARRAEDRLVSLSAGDAAQRWAEFSSNKIACDYCMGFSIIHTPRKSEERIFKGVIFGAVRGDSVLTRILVRPDGQGDWSGDFILVNSPSGSKVFRMKGGAFEELPPDKWEKPMIDGLIYSPFDILSPYRHWRAEYEGPGRIGQAVHFYRLRAGGAESKETGEIRIALSREFNSPIRVERISKDGRSQRTLSLGSVKKVDGLWIMLEASLRDDASRDKDLLKFNSAKLRLKLPDEIFDAASAKLPEIPILERF